LPPRGNGRNAEKATGPDAGGRSIGTLFSAGRSSGLRLMGRTFRFVPRSWTAFPPPAWHRRQWHEVVPALADPSGGPATASHRFPSCPVAPKRGRGTGREKGWASNDFALRLLFSAVGLSGEQAACVASEGVVRQGAARDG